MTMLDAVVDTVRLLAAPGPSLASHLATHGPLPASVDLAALAESVDLRGRGGAGFPTARKLRTVAAGGHAVVVANASEGEPLSAKDRTLLTRSPHLVLDGIALAAAAVGARSAYLTTARPSVASMLREEIARRSDPVRVEVVEVADRFVSGEESTVVNLINGRPPVPSDRAVRVFERGVKRRPTLVQNVETLAQLALLVRHGPAWFGGVGTVDEPGTLLTTVAGAVAHPGVVEVPHGVPLRDLLAHVGAERPQAVLVGGYHGTWLPGSVVPSVRLSRASLGAHGARIGAGVIAVLGHDRCGLVEAAGVASYLASEVVGQCGPCVNGMPALASVLQRLARGERDPRLVDEVARLSRLVDGRGACAHPDGTVRFVASTMSTFGGEVAVHLGGGCSAHR